MANHWKWNFLTYSEGHVNGQTETYVHTNFKVGGRAKESSRFKNNLIRPSITRNYMWVRLAITLQPVSKHGFVSNAAGPENSKKHPSHFLLLFTRIYANTVHQCATKHVNTLQTTISANMQATSSFTAICYMATLIFMNPCCGTFCFSTGRKETTGIKLARPPVPLKCSAILVSINSHLDAAKIHVTKSWRRNLTIIRQSSMHSAASQLTRNSSISRQSQQ